MPDRPATDTGSTGLRGAPGDRIAGDPSSHHRIPPAPACVPVVWDPDPGSPAPCGRDAPAPRWTQLVAVDGRECPGHGIRPLTQSRWPGDPGADLGGLPRRGHQRPRHRLRLAGPGVADAGVLGTPRPERRGSRHPWWRRHPHRGVGLEPLPLSLRRPVRLCGGPDIPADLPAPDTPDAVRVRRAPDPRHPIG